MTGLNYASLTISCSATLAIRYVQSWNATRKEGCRPQPYPDVVAANPHPTTLRPVSLSCSSTPLGLFQFG